MSTTPNFKERLTQLRKDNKKNINLIRKACRNTNGGRGWCNKFNGDATLCQDCIPREMKCDYTRYYPSLSQECLADGIIMSYATVQAVEQNGICSEETLSAYKNFFGEELFNKYLSFDVSRARYAGEEIIKETQILKPNYFVERVEELEQLRKLFEKNSVTIICGYGGVGKTVLAKEFLSKYLNGTDKFYQTISFINERGFNEEQFAQSVVLTDRGEFDFKNYVDENSDTCVKNLKERFIKEQIVKLKCTPVFLLDGFACIDKNIFKLQEDYPNCKFIITTRTVEGIGNNYSECILRLSNFNEDQSIEVFNNYRTLLELKKVTKDEFISIYNWCGGHAESLYYISKMLCYKAVDNFEDLLETVEFVAENKDTSKEEKSNMAQKLNKLFKLDEFLSNDEAQIKDNCKREKMLKALAILSLGANQTPYENLLKFLTDDNQSEELADEVLTLLLQKGYASLDSGNLYAPVVIRNALKLNGIQKEYTYELCIFAYLVSDTSFFETLFRVNTNSFSKLVLPNGLTKLPYLGEHAELAEIFIGRDIVEIEPAYFDKCLKLKDIKVSKENKQFKSLDGNLLLKGGRVFVRYALGKNDKSFTLPNGVIKIKRGAFSGCKNLESIKITEGVTHIGNEAFVGCDNLKEVYLPKSLKSVGYGAFYGLNIKKIYYEGTALEWEKIEFKNLSFNGLGKNTEICFNV